MCVCISLIYMEEPNRPRHPRKKGVSTDDFRTQFERLGFFNAGIY